MTTEFELVGGYAGKTINLGGHQFVDGVFSYGPNDDNVIPSEAEVKLKGDILAKMYQAYPVGSEALKAAKARIKAGGKATDRLDVAEREDKEQAERDEKPVKEQSERAAKGVIRTALTKLDPKNDEHWTEGGLPSVAAVRELSQNERVSRADITELAPNLTREEAAKAKGGDPLDEQAE